ncbi:hypothetical protein KAT80_02355 [Candidatus Pacearchaeota archaeon]|nr:hypothetical protein [Candidatus Pacearchaeota archaeon]
MKITKTETPDEEYWKEFEKGKWQYFKQNWLYLPKKDCFVKRRPLEVGGDIILGALLGEGLRVSSGFKGAILQLQHQYEPGFANIGEYVEFLETIGKQRLTKENAILIPYHEWIDARIIINEKTKSFKERANFGRTFQEHLVSGNYVDSEDGKLKYKNSILLGGYTDPSPKIENTKRYELLMNQEKDFHKELRKKFSFKIKSLEAEVVCDSQTAHNSAIQTYFYPHKTNNNFTLYFTKDGGSGTGPIEDSHLGKHIMYEDITGIRPVKKGSDVRNYFKENYDF